jgi:hypothetical protein
MALLRNALRFFLPMACVWTLAAGLVVLIQHQALRAQADEPQLQIAEEAALRLAGGADPKSVLPAANIALERSQSSFVTVYDSAGEVVASSASLHGAPPRMPAGVLDFALLNGGHRLSWQPQPGLRQALVIVPVRSGSAGFVVAGRSLRETERLKLQVLDLALIVWLAGLGACLPVAFAVARRAS